MASTSDITQRGSDTFLRVLGSLLGAYVFSWRISALGTVLLVALGVAYDTAHSLFMLLAFLVFLGVFLWAFAAEKLAQVWLVLVGGGTAMSVVMAVFTG